MENLLEKARRAGQANISVLIKGESGTGKELLARFIHLQSGRGGPFVAVNCGAIPENLLESELFGHVKGAFTGANTSRQGLISLANEGTLFLDELGDMPLTVQAKLLRTLQERKVRPVGSNDETDVDVMVVSATHQDINAMVSAGNFREDLYYRINVMEFTLPPLRERPEDIPLLAQHFLKLVTGEESRTMVIAPEAMEVLASQPFKGNVRQLYNVIQRLVAMSSGTVISASQVLDSLGHAKTNMPSFDEARAEFTRQYLTALLKLTGGNVSRAARLADRNRTDFHKLLKKFDIDSSKFKS
jgi:two-component system response regulator GlrR